MVKIRPGRVAEELKKELSQILQKEFKDPGIGFITITGVEITGDLSEAKVFLSVLGSEEQKVATLRALARGKGYLRSEIGKRMRLRIVPELTFKMDTSIEYGSHIQSLLAKINDGQAEE
ncbi:MAG: 30S ribosome-binding factor RbfA [Gorillibacterium sp.]|nr:30S ribosome-binding factor RbfA [Gorillibacterium sp.]